MTECNRQRLLFSSLGRQQVQADFAGGTLTQMPAACCCVRSSGARSDRCPPRGLSDPRDPSRITHDLRTLLAQRIYGLALGYEDLNDHTTLRTGPAVCRAWRTDSPRRRATAGQPPTLCRLENRIGRARLARLAGVLVEQFIASYDQPPEELILDFDATDDPVHGTQEGAFLPRLLRRLLLPAAVRVLWPATAGGLSAAEQHRRQPAQPADPQAAGPAAAAGLAQRADHPARRHRASAAGS